MTRRPARFWPLATLILLPVLVLAGVTHYGLLDQWQRAHDRARVEGERFARRAAQLWDESLSRKTGVAVSLYPEAPAPEPAGKEAEELEAAITAGDVAALRRLTQIQQGQPRTASGVPVRLMAAFHLWKRTGTEDDRRTVAMLALHRDACTLSPKILELLDASAREQQRHGDPWLAAWHDLEHRRALVAQMPPYRSKTILRDGESRRAWLQRRAPGDRIAVTLDAELARFYDDFVQVLRDEAPPWAAFVVNADSRVYGPAEEINLQPDYGMAQAGEFFRIQVGMKDHSAFSGEHSRLVHWAWSVVTLAGATALLGLWLVRRTLNKERRLGELKSQFVSSVSHELRAPVGSLRLMAEGLASGRITGAAADEFHRLMAGEGARLSSLIENVLDFARIEQGRKEYHFAETDIAALVQDAVKLMSPQAEARGLRIECECEALPFVPKVDAGAVQQALINLLDNAVKFTPANAARLSNVESAPDSTLESRATILVRLAVDPSRNTWSLSVTDHGPGIPREEHARIFERFYRLGNELRRETTGTGIGLALVKHIVEAHGGIVTVESVPGKGSTFRMEFPA